MRKASITERSSASAEAKPEARTDPRDTPLTDEERALLDFLADAALQLALRPDDE